MDRNTYRKFLGLQLFGLVLLLCGQWHIAMVLFVVGHIMQVKRTVREDDEPRPRPVPAPKPCPRKHACDECGEYGEYESSDAYMERAPYLYSADNKPQEAVTKTKVRKRNGKYRAISRMLVGEDGNYSKYKPNAYVIRGPEGAPVVCDYDDNGIPTDNGMEVSVDGWLSEVCSDQMGMRGTAVVLAHVVKGSNDCLVQALQVNDIEYNGRPMTVSQIAEDGKLLEIAEALRRSYMEEVGE